MKATWTAGIFVLAITSIIAGILLVLRVEDTSTATQPIDVLASTTQEAESLDRETTSQSANEGTAAPEATVASPKEESAPSRPAGASPATASGRVVDLEGRAVAGATVLAQIDDGLFGTIASDPQILPQARAITDLAGEFSFELSLGQSLDLQVEAKGFATHTSANHAAGDFIELTLLPAIDVTVELTTESGDPVSDALVITRPPQPDSTYPLPVVIAEAKTNGSGRAVLNGLSEGSWFVGVVPPHAVSFQQRIDVRAGDQTVLRWQVEEGIVVSGEVVDQRTGLAIEGATLECQDQFSQPQERRSVLSDATGQFRLDGVRRGKKLLRVSAPGYTESRTRLRPDDAAVDSLKIELRAGRRLRGRFIDARGTPVPDLRFRVACYEDGHHEIASRADSDGRFEVDELLPDSIYLLCPVSNEWAASAIPTGSKEDLGDIPLIAPARIEGRVLDEIGHPAAGLNASLTILVGRAEEGIFEPGEETIESLSWRSIRTNLEGRFAFGALAPGRYRVSISQRGVLGSERIDVELSPGEARRDIEIVFPMSRTISGRVTDPDGRPVSGVYLRAGDEETNVGLGRAVSNADGAFTVPVRRPGPFRLAALPPGDEARSSGPALGPAFLARVAPGTEGIEIVLPELAPFEGKLIGLDEEPIGPAYLQVLDSMGNRLTGQAIKEDGAFSVAVPEPSILVIEVTPLVPQENGGMRHDTDRKQRIEGLRPGRALRISLPWDR
ncbi:MAG: carboxypeptidase-like regulatory domain-containing protein [Planctomycetota bacterium]